MSLDVTGWLRDLGLEQYVSAFRDNAIDAEVLQSPPAEDLKEIGVTLVGHRRRLLDAIAALRSNAKAESFMKTLKTRKSMAAASRTSNTPGVPSPSSSTPSTTPSAFTPPSVTARQLNSKPTSR